MTTTKPETRPVTFQGREIATLQPSAEHVAVMVRMSKFEQNTGSDTRKQAAMINRVPVLGAALCADPDDWDTIEDGMAARTVTWEEVVDFIVGVCSVWGADNRAAKRATAKKTTARRAR